MARRRIPHRHCIVLLLCCAAMAVYAQSPEEIARTGFASTVTVLTFDGLGGFSGHGSGFTIGEGIVMTNAHVINDAASLMVRRIGAQDAMAVTSVPLIDEQLDLALLTIDGYTGPPLAVRTSGGPVIGEQVFVMGSPLGLEGTFSHGIVSGRRSLDDVDLMQITAPISPGSSGGPVVDSDARVVGVVAATLAEGQNLNFAISVKHVREFLARLPNHIAPVGVSGESEHSVEGAQGPGPSFDCALAATWSERAICSSERLAALDRRLDEVYMRVRGALDSSSFSAVRDVQREWLMKRESCESRAVGSEREVCLVEMIESRIGELRRLLPTNP